MVPTMFNSPGGFVQVEHHPRDSQHPLNSSTSHRAGNDNTVGGGGVYPIADLKVPWCSEGPMGRKRTCFWEDGPVC